jgi:RNA polymerase sigma factor (sigma-70 family)
VDRSGLPGDVPRAGIGRDAFETVFVTHYARVLGILRRVVGNAGRADELASEVFLKLYRLGEWPSDMRASTRTQSESASELPQFSSQAEKFGELSALPPTGDAERFDVHEGRNRAHLAGWLYRTATNLGIDALRAEARRARYEQHAAQDGAVRAAPAEDGYERTLREERQRRVRAVLGDLKVAQAQLLLLRAEGFSYKELAEAVSVEASSVGTLLVRAEAAFAQRYRESFGEEDL